MNLTSTNGAIAPNSESNDRTAVTTKITDISVPSRRKVGKSKTSVAPGSEATQIIGQPSPVKPNSRLKVEADPKGAAQTKSDIVLKKLRSAKGATLDALMEATGWQAHSVRGFLSGTVKKRLGQVLFSEKGKDDVRRYRVTGDGK